MSKELYGFDDPDFDISNDIENQPYCQCDLEPTEDEEASNVCACCGKLFT